MKLIVIIFIEAIVACRIICIGANGVNAMAGIGIVHQMLIKDNLVSDIRNSNWTEALITNIAQLIELNKELEQVLKDDPTTVTDDISAINQVLELALNQTCSLVNSIVPSLENFNCSLNELRLLSLKLKMFKVSTDLIIRPRTQVNRCEWQNETIYQAVNPTDKMLELQTYMKTRKILSCR